jgi:predicted RND superfamily exporter protein
VSPITRLLRFARRSRGLVLAATAVLSLGSAWLATRISFDTDVLGLLPQNDPSLRAFRQYLERFGAADQLYIVFDVDPVVDDAQIADAGPLIESYVRRLRALPEIAKVDAGLFDPGKDWTYLQDRTFVLIGPADTRKALSKLDNAGLREALVRSRQLLVTPSPEVRQLVQTDPLGWFALVRDHFASDRAFAGLDINRRGYFSADGRSRLVMATPSGPPFDTDFCRRLFAKLSEVEAEARREATSEAAAGVGVPRIAYAGGHRIAVETEVIIKREASLNSLTSVAAILLLLLIVFRSPWLFFVGALPMAVATLTSIAINGLMREHLSLAATGTSALLFGLGIDGVVLLYARYLETMASGVSASRAIEALSGASSSMLLGCFTTAATFFGLTVIDLPGLQELGRLVGVGMVLGGPLTLVLVAALLPSTVKTPRVLSATGLVHFVRRYRVPILVGAVVATVAALPMMTRLNLDLRLEQLQPNTPATALQRQLGQRFGVDRDVALAIGQHADLEELVAADRRFEAAIRAEKPSLSLSGPSRMLPPLEEQDATGRALATASEQIATIQTRVRRRAEEVGFRSGALDDFIERLPRLLDPGQRLTYQGYLDHGLADLVSRFVVHDSAGYTSAAYVEIDRSQDLAEVEAAVGAANADLTLTGVPVVDAVLSARFGPQFVIALVVGAVVVFLLILLTLKDVMLSTLALLPTVLGLTWASALLAQLSVRLDLFSIFALTALIGIGVDYGIHLVHRAAAEPEDFDLALSRVAPSNLVAAGIALLGCGSLTTSAYPPLRSLGIVTIVGLTTCLISAVLVLPALLMGRAPTKR